MSLLKHLDVLTAYDWCAVVFLLLCWWFSGWITEHSPKRYPSVTDLMSQKRHEWMKVLIHRDPRIFDSQVIMSLKQSTSFFASTCVLAIGGAVALWSDPKPLQGVASELIENIIHPVVWQTKMSLVIWLLMTGFLRFVWSNRIFGYCSVVMAAIPLNPDHDNCLPQAYQAAALNIRAGVNFNRGLRAIYFALGSLAWLMGPVALFIATLAVTWIVVSREFWSIPRDILLGKHCG